MMFSECFLSYSGLNDWTKAAENPFLSGSVLHPNQFAPLNVSWRLAGFPAAGAVLLSSDVVANDPNWSGQVEVILGVKQGDFETKATYIVGGLHAKAVGISFTSTGAPYDLSVQIRLLNHEDFIGSSLTFDFFRYINPASETTNPRMYTVMEGAGRSLISCNQGGLVNRLISLFSTMYIADRMSRDVHVWWGENAHCAAAMDDLFSIYRSNPSYMSDFDVYFDECNKLIEDFTSRRDVLVHAIKPIRSRYVYDFAHLGPYMSRLVYSEEVKRKIEAYRDIDFSDILALHVRLPYENGQFAALESRKFPLKADDYIKLIDIITRSNKEIRRILLCTNSKSLEDGLIDRFGDFIFRHEKSSFDNSGDAVAVQDALVDLELMRRCPIMISQQKSAFGHMAHISGVGKRLYLLSNETTNEIFKLDVLEAATLVGHVNVDREDTNARLDL